jgi:16S rRNA (uracil1498-N3)-methyltransferase
MSCPWFHVPHVPPQGDAVALDRDEARHALGVRRLGAGDVVVVFDGRGTAADAVLTGDRDRDGGPVATVGAPRSVPRPGPDVVAGVAPPKGDRWSTALDMLGQLGVRTVVPIDAEHGVVDAGGINRPRAERILLEAAKQSRAGWACELAPHERLGAFVARMAADGRAVYLADRDGAPLPAVAPARVAFAVGPEGGFTAAEAAEAVAAGAVPAAIGTQVLRVEAAAVAFASALRARAG